MKNIRLFLQFCIFVVVVCGAVLVIQNLGTSLDDNAGLTVESGLLSAPDIDHGHGAVHGESEGHGNVEEGHGDSHGDAAATEAHAEAEKKTLLT